MKVCKDCQIVLNKNNWPAWRKKRHSHVCKSCSRVYYKNAHIRQRDARNERQRNYRMGLKEKIVAAYGGKCTCCGEQEIKFLTIEHKNNNGAEHRRALGGSKNVHNWIIKNNYPKDMTVLCFNCNAASFYYGVCPHKKVPACTAFIGERIMDFERSN